MLYQKRHNALDNLRDYRAHAGHASALSGLAPAQRGQKVPYHQAVRNQAMQAAKGQTLTHFQIQRQLANDLLNAQIAEERTLRNQVDMALRLDAAEFQRQVAHNELELRQRAQQFGEQESVANFGLRADAADRGDRALALREGMFQHQLGQTYRPEDVERYTGGALPFSGMQERPHVQQARQQAIDLEQRKAQQYSPTKTRPGVYAAELGGIEGVSPDMLYTEDGRPTAFNQMFFDGIDQILEQNPEMTPQDAVGQVLAQPGIKGYLGGQLEAERQRIQEEMENLPYWGSGDEREQLQAQQKTIESQIAAVQKLQVDKKKTKSKNKKALPLSKTSFPEAMAAATADTEKRLRALEDLDPEAYAWVMANMGSKEAQEILQRMEVA